MTDILGRTKLDYEIDDKKHKRRKKTSRAIIEPINSKGGAGADTTNKMSKRKVIVNKTGQSLVLLIIKIVLIIGLLWLVLYFFSRVQNGHNLLKLNTIELETTQFKLEDLNKKYKDLEAEKVLTEEQKNIKLLELETQKAELEKQLQSKLDTQEKIAQDNLLQVEAKVYADAAPMSSGLCNTGNVYKDYIYNKESTCNPSAVNSIGCRGIGQACPGDKLPCGADFACQDAWFSNYAVERYGSWENAYHFWLENSWW